MIFSNIGFEPATASAFERAVRGGDFSDLTAVQKAAIPAILQGRDVLVSAQTGSGKTAAFALPVLQQLVRLDAPAPSKLRCLILVPTRELAVQVEQVMRQFAQYLPRKIKLLAVFGGVSEGPQVLALRTGIAVLIGTPGRLLDLVDQGAVSLKHTRYVVLDEADRLLDLGFVDEVNRIFGELPKRKQSMFFSATFGADMEALAASRLREPVRVDIQSEQAEPLQIEERAVSVDTARRTQLFRKLFVENDWERALVFVARQFDTEKIAMKLRAAGLRAEPLHGQLTQGKRMQVVQDLKASRIQIVVATDLASRGLDIRELPVVVNYDLPRSTVDYTHRIGRTGRAGMSGLAVSFVTADALAHWQLIVKRQSMVIELDEVEGFEPTELVAEQAQRHPSGGLDPHGGIKGKRMSKKDKLRAAAAKASAVKPGH